MFEGYYTKGLWGDKMVWRSSWGLRADYQKWLGILAIFGGLPSTPKKTSKLSYPLKGLWYSTPQTYVKIKLIALLLLWFFGINRFAQFCPYIIYYINFEVEGGTLNVQKIGFFFTWWSQWVHMNGIRGLTISI